MLYLCFLGVQHLIEGGHGHASPSQTLISLQLTRVGLTVAKAGGWGGGVGGLRGWGWGEWWGVGGGGVDLGF